MTFDELLSEYETKMNTIEVSYNQRLQENCSAQADIEKQIADYKTQVSSTIDEINLQESAKFILDAARELNEFFTEFNIQNNTPNFLGDSYLQELYLKLDNIKSKLGMLYAKKTELETKLKQIRDDYEIAKREIVKPVRESYDIIAGKMITSIDLCNHALPNAQGLPREIFIGNVIKPTNSYLTHITNESVMRFPLSLDIQDEGNIIIEGENISDEIVSGIIVALAIQYISAFQYGTLNIDIINYTSHPFIDAFQKAIAKTEASQNEIVTDIKGIDQLIPEITNRCAETNGKLLSNASSDIFQLYKKGVTTDKFHLVIIKNALKDINESNLRAIYSWIATYKKCGVRIIMIDDFGEESFRGKSLNFKAILEKIRQECCVFSFKPNGIISDKNEQVELISIAENNTDIDVYNYCKKYIDNAASQKSAYVSYEQIGFGTDMYKDNETIYIPVAYNSPSVWYMAFNCTAKAPLANLIVGIPGTGKSRLIDAMILNGAIKYSPEELIFHLLDFKKGLSSNAYLEDCKIPHVKVVSRNNNAEDADVILSSILAEEDARAAEFKKYSVDSIAGYNKVSAVLMPRLIIVIDECQHIFENEILAKKCEAIAREGRSLGIHLVLATQTVTPQMMKTIKFVDGRYCFQISSDDAEQLLDKIYSKRIGEISKSTHKVFVTDFSSGNREIIKIEPAFDGDFDDGRVRRSAYAKQIREKWDAYQIDVFDVGNQEAIYFSQENLTAIMKLPLMQFCLGQNFQNRADIKLNFKSEKQSSLFLVSSKICISENIMASIVIQAWLKKFDMRVVNATGNQLLGTVLAQMGLSEATVFDENGYLKSLYDLYNIYQERMKKPTVSYPPIFFVVNGLQNILDFVNNTKYANRNGNSSYESISLSPSRLSYTEMRELRRGTIDDQDNGVAVTGRGSFFELLSNGYRVNIYICATIDSINLSNSSGSIFSSGDRNVIKQCTYKILDSDVGEDCRSIMEGSFREKMLYNMADNVCFMSEKQKNYYKFKYFKYDSSSAIAIISNLYKKIKGEN